MTSAKTGLRIAVTGAAGFIGRAVVDRIASGAMGAVAELRLNDVETITHTNAVIIGGSYCQEQVRRQLVAGGVEILLHLASLPGGASEHDHALGRAVNLDGSMALFDAVACASAPIIVYASSIAALGRATQPVTDDTAPRPTGSYGTHKAMMELYLADLTRRRLVDARSVRPAGVVARPTDAYAGFATSWMSDLFRAARDCRAIAIPARADAHLWLQSVDTVADNIIHAALMPAAGLSAHRAWTLPATVVAIDQLIDALSRFSGYRMQVEYTGGATNQPPLDASAALAMGFKTDGDADALVAAVMARIARE